MKIHRKMPVIEMKHSKNGWTFSIFCLTTHLCLLQSVVFSVAHSYHDCVRLLFLSFCCIRKQIEWVEFNSVGLLKSQTEIKFQLIRLFPFCVLLITLSPVPPGWASLWLRCTARWPTLPFLSFSLYISSCLSIPGCGSAELCFMLSVGAFVLVHPELWVTPTAPETVSLC